MTSIKTMVFSCMLLGGLGTVSPSAVAEGRGVRHAWMRGNVGITQGGPALRDAFGVGLTVGFNGAIFPLSIGNGWQVGSQVGFAYSWFGAADDASLTGSLSMRQLNVSVAAQGRLGRSDRLIGLVFGANVTRTSVAITDAQKRSFLGPSAEITISQLFGRSLLSLGFRYYVIDSKNGTASLFLGFGYGQ